MKSWLWIPLAFLLMGQATPTATPTPTGPTMCSVTGSVVNADGSPFVNGVITFNSKNIQVINGVPVNPTNVTTNTDASGVIRAISLPQGLVVQVTVCPPAQGQGQPANCSAPFSAFIPFSTSASFGNLSQGTSLSPPNPPGSAPQLIGYNASNAVTAATLGGDISLAGIAPTYTATVLKLNGQTPGGACPANQFTSAISTSGVPTCSAPAGSSIPTGPFQTLQSNASNASVWNSNIAIGMPVATPTAGQNTALQIASAGSTTWAGTSYTNNGGVNNQANAWGVKNPPLTSGTGLYAAYYANYCDPALGNACTGPNDFYMVMQANGAGSTIATPLSAELQTVAPAGLQINNLAANSKLSIYSGGLITITPSGGAQLAQWRTGGLDIGSTTVGADAIDVTGAGSSELIYVKNTGTSTTGQAGFGATNNVSGVNLWLNQTGPNYTGSTVGPNTGYLYADRGLALLSGQNDGSPITMWVAGAKMGTLSNTGGYDELMFTGGGINSGAMPNMNYVAGAHVNAAGSWLADATSANIINEYSATIGFYADTGLTAASTFSPTLRAKIDSAWNEVTFTPVLSFGGGSVGIVYTSQGGECWSFSRFAYCEGVVTLSSKGTSTGNVKICNLPLIPSGAGWMGGTVNYFYGFTGFLGTPTLITNSDGCVQVGQGNPNGFVAATDANFTATSNFQFSVYFVQ